MDERLRVAPQIINSPCPARCIVSDFGLVISMIISTTSQNTIRCAPFFALPAKRAPKLRQGSGRTEMIP
ncbi:hypothetical protein HBI88_137170 [Parastagonospora nodorum]|nr:hypothetical protein HBI97_166260 [Parastagonospora nodorum]KAH5823059.1 hypothetical protein HBI96_031740 [Parastagonospora nodorum]KAH5835892.1 hypothetical protein HBI94_000960 [Parastagonospora nodorum]KAH5841224.1 hypothetical protein HBI93_025510 [Parastagonospora nodorum]KAH5878179.1 hypothetical protein HBI90_052640 [Parastagonospora nodorum]